MNFEEKNKKILSEAKSLLSGCSDAVANMANLSALIYQEIEGLNWAGFYVFKDGKLVLGPFQGRPACIFIPLGKGVCGTAAQKGETVVVEDVHQFAGHIACDSASNSEIVVPIFNAQGVLYGVLDIDSPLLKRFGSSEKTLFEDLAAVFAKYSAL